MTAAVVLGDWELTTVTELTVREQRKLARHAVPGWDGDLVQDLGAAAVEIHLRGVDVADSEHDAGDRINDLRTAAQAGEPLDFTASAAATSAVEQVLITGLAVRQLPGSQRCLSV